MSTHDVPEYIADSMRRWRATAELIRYFLAAVRGQLAVARMGCEAETLREMQRNLVSADQAADLMASEIGCHLEPRPDVFRCEKCETRKPMEELNEGPHEAAWCRDCYSGRVDYQHDMAEDRSGPYGDRSRMEDGL